jgi:hypothetical protein
MKRLLAKQQDTNKFKTLNNKIFVFLYFLINRFKDTFKSKNESNVRLTNYFEFYFT